MYDPFAVYLILRILLVLYRFHMLFRHNVTIFRKVKTFVQDPNQVDRRNKIKTMSWSVSLLNKLKAFAKFPPRTFLMMLLLYEEKLVKAR